MTTVQITHNGPAVAQALRQRGVEAVQAIDEALHRGALEVHREAVRRAPKAESQLITNSGVQHPGPLQQHVVFGQRYAGYVEKGAGPGGQPTLADVVAWIRRRGITPRTPGMTVNQLAHVIRRGIAHHGTPAQPFAGPALDALQPRLVDLVQGAALRVLDGST